MDEKYPYFVEITVKDFVPSNIFKNCNSSIGGHGWSRYQRGQCVQEHNLTIEMSWDELGEMKKLIEKIEKARTAEKEG